MSRYRSKTTIRKGPQVTRRGSSGTFTWGLKRLYIDICGEYNLSLRLALFANLRSIGDATEDMEVVGPNTPPHAQFCQRLDFASLWTFGFKGSF